MPHDSGELRVGRYSWDTTHHHRSKTWTSSRADSVFRPPDTEPLAMISILGRQGQTQCGVEFRS